MIGCTNNDFHLARKYASQNNSVGVQKFGYFAQIIQFHSVPLFILGQKKWKNKTSIMRTG